MYKRAKEEREAIAARIKELREKYGLTRAKMYERIGVPPRTIQSWEEGDTAPALYVVDWIEKMLESGERNDMLTEDEKQELQQAIEKSIADYQKLSPATVRQQNEIDTSINALKSASEKIFGNKQN